MHNSLFLLYVQTILDERTIVAERIRNSCLSEFPDSLIYASVLPEKMPVGMDALILKHQNEFRNYFCVHSESLYEKGGITALHLDAPIVSEKKKKKSTKK